MARTSRGNRGKGKRRLNPKPKIRTAKPVLKSKLICVGNRKYAAEITLLTPGNRHSNKTCTTRKVFRKTFCCQGMEKATNVMLPAFAMEVNPCMWERGHDAKVGAEMKAVAPKVRATIERRKSSKLVMDVTVVNKEDATEVEVFLECILENQVVEIIYLHGATPLQAGGMFEKLLHVLQKPTVWSINLGELNFSAPQLRALQAALAQSNVTHMFYECMNGSQLKTDLSDAVRENRRKHSLWKYSDDDDAHNDIVRKVEKNWFNPSRHTCNIGHL